MDRRDFLKTAAAVPAAAGTPEQQSPIPEASTISRPGSDFMVDFLKSLDFEYAFSNPANTFRSLHESIIHARDRRRQTRRTRARRRAHAASLTEMQPRRLEDTKKTFSSCVRVFVVAFAVVASAGTSASPYNRAPLRTASGCS